MRQRFDCRRTSTTATRVESVAAAVSIRLRRRPRRTLPSFPHKLKVILLIRIYFLVCAAPPHISNGSARGLRRSQVIVLPKRKGGNNETIIDSEADICGRARGFAGGSGCVARPRPKHPGYGAAGRLEAPTGPTAESFHKPKSLPALPVQRSPNRRLEPQSRRLRKVGLHRPQVKRPSRAT